MPRASLFACCLLVVSCAQPDVLVNCTCISVPIEKALVEGELLVTTEAIEVESGDYVAPLPSAEPVPITFRFEEDWLVGTIGTSMLRMQVSSHLQLVHTPGTSGRCCGPAWDDLSLDRSPRPWSEHNAVRMNWSYDFGDSFVELDPSVVAFGESVLFDGAHDHRIFEADADGQGFVTNAWYAVQEPGCTADECVSTVRVQRHFRRPE